MKGPTLLGPLLRAARPRQWIKNLFVGAPLLFAKSLLDVPLFLRAAAAVAAFCVISSSVYLWNDIADVEKDRAHPVKRLRPIASGELPIPTARACAIVFALIGLGAGFAISPWFAAAGALYLGLNVAYSLSLKHVPYLDVLVIAAGFLIRVNAGAAAASVTPSRWLFVCTGLLACFFGFGKRAHELERHGAGTRGVLSAYHPERLKLFLYASGGLTVCAYTAYTLADHTRAFFGRPGHPTWKMALTVPFIAIGVIRFLMLGARPDADSPTEEMLRDPVSLATFLAWIALVVGIIYFGG